MTAIVAAAGPSAYWYLARGTGVVSLLLLSASVVLGVLGSVRFALAPRWPRFAIDALHRDVSLLVIVLLAAHIVTSVLDSFAPVALTDAVIPFASSYRPLWLGLGALSFDILLALVITSLVRRRLGYRTWRTIHWLAYASWPVAVLHGLGTGSDTKIWWMLALTVGCIAAVLAAVWTRIRRSSVQHQRFGAPAIALALATPLGIAIFTLAGPLQRGWAGRAGTPASLLARTVPATAAPAGVRPVSPPLGSAPALSPPFSAHLAGTVLQTPEAGGAIIDLALRLSGGARGRLRIRLAGSPIDGGGLSLTGSQVDLKAGGLASVMQGKVVSLAGQRFAAHVAGSAGSALDLRADLSIDSQTGSVSGTLYASPTGSGR
ncbi:MAG: ferric reductase-like transmembrane domain-containing protein [Solirubrobacteraceae bacterium]